MEESPWLIQAGMGDFFLRLLACLLAGGVLAWKWPSLPEWLAPPLVRVGVPFSLAALLLRSGFSRALLHGGLLGLLVPLLCLLILLAIAPLRRRFEDPSLILGAAVGNTGYWGLPVALALLPSEAMATAAAYDMAGTLITWSVGPLVLQRLHGKPFRHGPALLASPALHGAILAALISQSPWRVQLAQALWWPARLVFVLALCLLGMRLALSLRGRMVILSSGLSWALAFKLLLVPAIVLALCSVLRLPMIDRQALVLQGAAPTALAVLLISEAEQEVGDLASTLVLTSTALALLTVPLWWRLIR